MEGTLESNNNLIMENGTVEVLYVELGEENQTSTDAQSLSLKRKPVKTRSVVYQFFDWEEETNEWSCNICKKKYSPSIAGGTGSLTNHMKKDHLQEYEDAKKKEAERKTKNVVQFNQKDGPREITKQTFRQKLIEFMICTDQGFTLVEDPFFRDLIDYCSGGNSECELFSARTAKSLIVDLYKEKRANVERVLQNNEGKISYIVDCWTSSNQFPFQGVVAKWISDDWQMCTTVVDLTVLQGSHKGKFIAKAFWNVLTDYGLCKKLLSLTTDNASNMDTMFEELEILALGDDIIFDSKNYRVRCFAHIMNLSCQDMINSIGDGGADAYSSDNESDDEHETVTKKELPVVTKLRKGVVAIRRSPQRRELFIRQCVAAKIENETKMVLRDVRTRWNSTLIMCERAKELKEPFDLTLRSIPKLRKYVLDDDEWCKINELIKILSPFREATVMLSNDHSPTMSRVTSVYQVLLEHLEKYAKNECNALEPGPSKRKKINSQGVRLYPEWLVHAAKLGLDKLEKYYPSTDGLVYIVSTDPRYKLTWYKATGWPKDWIDFCRKSVTELYKSQYKPQAQDQPLQPTTSKDARQSYYLFDDLFNTQMKNHTKSCVDDELKKYLNDGVVDPDLLIKEKTGIDGALGWWKIHNKEFPNLSKMAKDFLPASGTGVPVERLFSSGPDLLSPRRQALSPETIKICICLKSWLKNNQMFEANIREAISHKLGADAHEFNLL